MTMILTDRHESECNKMTEKYSFDTGLSCGDDSCEHFLFLNFHSNRFDLNQARLRDIVCITDLDSPGLNT